MFTSVASSQVLNEEDYWNDLFLNHRDNYLEDMPPDHSIPPIHDSWLTTEELKQRYLRSSVPTFQPESSPSMPLASPNTLASDDINPRNLLDDLDNTSDVPYSPSNDTILPTIPESAPDTTIVHEPTSPTPARPNRSRKPNPKYFNDQWINIGSCSRSPLRYLLVSLRLKDLSSPPSIGMMSMNPLVRNIPVYSTDLMPILTKLYMVKWASLPTLIVMIHPHFLIF
jgi:hypothetical protein